MFNKKWYIPFLHVFSLRRFNTKFLSPVILICIIIWAVPDLVPLHVILTQNSAKKERMIHLTHNAADNDDSVTKRTGQLFH